MYFREDVVAAAVRAVEADIAGVTIPEESIGSGFWAACKSFERSFYVGDSSVTAARFFERDLYLRAGGFDENLVSGEDWDLSLRVGAMGRIATADTIIYHDEGHLQLAALLRKKFYYGCHIRRFMEKHGIEALKRISPLRQAYTRNLRKFFSNPSITFGMVFMRLCESAAGALGLIYSFVQTR
jgi:arabinofuranan 3-O-arabinosyltransferase